MAISTASLSSLQASLVYQVDVATLPSPGSVGVDISGNWSGTLTFQATINQVNWFNILAIPATSVGGSPTASTTSNGQFIISVAGYAQVQVVFTSYVSGLAVVSMDATNAPLVNLSQIAVQTQSTTLGGPPLASGLSGGITSDSEVSYQAKDSIQAIVLPTTAGQSFLTFLDNPWVNGLSLFSRVLLSGGPNSVAAEEVVIGSNNIPNAALGAITVNLVNPVVNSGMNFATFDDYDIDGPIVTGAGTPLGATLVGIKGQLQYVIDPKSPDPKRPVFASTQAPSAPGVPAMIPVLDPLGSNDLTLMRRVLEQILIELRSMNMMIAQLKDSGSMDVPAGIFISSADSMLN